MKKFKSRSVVVEAFRWTGTRDFLSNVPAGILSFGADNGTAFISTPDGDREVGVGDWIVKDGSGAYWPMRDDIFQLKYEPMMSIGN